ncbi:LCP family protein [Enterococcus hirae]|nr:LCP family protein [Enterococcus hirae]
MSKLKVFFLSLLALFLLVIAGVSVYAVRLVDDAQGTLKDVHQSTNRLRQKDDKIVHFSAQDPFSILLLGVDTGDLGRTDQGRSDTMMYVTVNPKKEKTVILSLDRDIYTNIVGYNEDNTPFYDKLNHAYAYGAANNGDSDDDYGAAGGAAMAMDTVDELLDAPVNHYLTINLKGFTDLVDAVGGIDVDNKYEFELDGVHLKKGKHHLNGKQAQAYSRYRHEDPKGDVGRQERQREVVQKIMHKMLGYNTLSHYKKVFKAVQKNIRTDLTWDDMVQIIEGYKGATSHIESKQLYGEDAMMNDVYYQILNPADLLKTQNYVKEQLGLATSTELPAANQFLYNYYTGNGSYEGDSFQQKENSGESVNTSGYGDGVDDGSTSNSQRSTETQQPDYYQSETQNNYQY